MRIRSLFILLYINVVLLSGGALFGRPGSDDDVAATTKPAEAAEPGAAGSPILPVMKPSPRDETDRVDWRGVAGQSFRFLLLQQGFRMATEEGARHSHLPFFRGYLDSVTNIHGWADGDPFYVNYVGHPMSGATAAFIWVQNDGTYRRTEFGRDRNYWRGRLRAAGYAFLYSALFELGPISEASIGATQAYFPQQGFVDHVITPTVGLGWMIAEDAMDRYVIRWFETKSRNPYWRFLVRGALNPTRSLSNVLAGRRPWDRDTRPGVTAFDTTPYSNRPARQNRTSRSEAQPAVAPFEFQLQSVTQFPLSGGNACMGGSGAAAFRLTPELQAVIEVGGCKMLGLPAELSGDSLTYLVGPRWTPGASERWRPYAHVLIGGNKITQERMDRAMKKQLAATAQAQGRQLDFPDHHFYTESTEANGFSLSVGAGIERKLNGALALRIAGFDYSRSWMRPLEGMDRSANLRLTTGLVLRMGTW